MTDSGVLRYILFEFGMPFFTLHLFSLKDKVSRRSVETAAGSRQLTQ
jgi:hypothetical protein